MRKQLAKTLAKVSLLGMVAMFLAVGSAQGQSLADRITANIPFDFTVVNKKLPAGKYSVARAQQSAGDTILSISAMNSLEQALSMTSAAYSIDPHSATTLVFHRYGDQYFLFQIWLEGANSGRTMVKSQSERKLEQKARESIGASNRKTVETVSIVAELN
jgi:hypothetical protein